MTSIVFTASHQAYDDKEVSVVIQELPIRTSSQVPRRASLVEKQPVVPSQDDQESAVTIVEEWDGGWDAWSNVAGGYVHTETHELYTYLHACKVAGHGCIFRGPERLRCIPGLLHEG